MKEIMLIMAEEAFLLHSSMHLSQVQQCGACLLIYS